MRHFEPERAQDAREVSRCPYGVLRSQIGKPTIDSAPTPAKFSRNGRHGSSVRDECEKPIVSWIGHLG
jgi:hypothetical protein